MARERSQRGIVTRALVVLASLILLLCAAECAVRVVDAAPQRVRSLPAEHPLARRLVPNRCESAGGLESAWFVQMCTNRLGLRDREHAATEESPRVVVLGDAATVGVGVERGDTFVSRLELGLRLGLPARRPGVFNVGLAETSQVHQEALLRQVYEVLRPDVVVVAFAEEDDLDENVFWNPHLGAYPGLGELSLPALAAYRKELHSAAPGSDSVFDHAALVRWFRQRRIRASLSAELDALERRLEAHGLARAPLNVRVSGESARRFRMTFSNRYDDDFALTEISLERIRLFAQKRGAMLVLLRVPSRASVDDESWKASRVLHCGPDAATVRDKCGDLARDRTARRLAAYAKAHDLVYVDAGSDLSAALAGGQVVYLPQEHLPGRLGHARIAGRLVTALLPLLGGKPPVPAFIGALAKPKRKVGAHFRASFASEDWRGLADDRPARGAYASADPAAIAQQLHWAERAELDFFLVELGADSREKRLKLYATVDRLASAILERRRRGLSQLGFATLLSSSNTEQALNDVWQRFVEPYREAYVTVNDKPLVAVLAPRAALEDARFTIIGLDWLPHEKWQASPRSKGLVPLWDSYPQAVTDRRFLSVAPGYDDRLASPAAPRAPTLPRLEGRTFVQQWRRAFEVHPEIVFVHSYNDYISRSQIEPTAAAGDRYLVLNQLLARRFKDGRLLSDSEAERLPELVRLLLETAADKAPVAAPMAERRDFGVADRDVDLDGFWNLERHSTGHLFRWSQDRATITVSGLPKGALYRVTLTFLDTGKSVDVALGPDHEHVQRVRFAANHTATLPMPIAVSQTGKLRVGLQTATWRPSEAGGTDERALGLALRLVTLDRVEVASAPNAR